MATLKTSNIQSHQIDSSTEKTPLLIDYPSPAIAKLIREQFTTISSVNGILRGWCLFCKATKTFDASSHGWLNHMCAHTGEHLFECRRCHRQMNDIETISNTNCAHTQLKSTFEAYENTDHDIYGYTLYGFMCNICNYVQVSEMKLCDHIKNIHAKAKEITMTFDSTPQEHFDGVLLVQSTLSTYTNCYMSLNNIQIDSEEHNSSSSISNNSILLPQPKHTLYPTFNIQTDWWQTTKNANTTWNIPAAGMVNVGTSCYLNSTLQALFHVPAFANWLLMDDAHREKCAFQCKYIIAV